MRRQWSYSNSLTFHLNDMAKLSMIEREKKREKLNKKYLSKINNKVKIFNDNQKIIDKSDWIFLAVTPVVGKKILKNLNFKKTNTIISFISTIKMSELKNLTKYTYGSGKINSARKKYKIFTKH